MKAVVKTRKSRGGLEVLDMPDPIITDPDDVLVEVRSTAICGSDLHSYEYVPSYHWIKIPIIPGHEFSGVVIATGEEVRNFKKNERVMGESNCYCGTCRNCMDGRTNICSNNLMRGLAVDGVMSEYVLTKERYLHHVPQKLPFDEAAAAQACTVSVHGIVDRTQILPGDMVIVFGVGILGFATAQLARLKGAIQVVLVGVDVDEKVRLPIAREMGFPTINMESENLEESIKNIVGHTRFDVAVDCSGAASAVLAGLNLVKKGGVLSLLGLPNRDIEFPFASAIRSEINIVTSYTSTWKDYELTLKLLDEKKLDISRLIVPYSLGDANSAFEDALSQKIVKAVLRP